MKKTILFAAALLIAGALTGLTKADEIQQMVINGIRYDVNMRYHSAHVIANNYSGSVVIPDMFNVTVDDPDEGKIERQIWVEGIAPDAFRNCADLYSVRIPGMVNYLESGTFSGCTGLRSIIIADPAKRYPEDEDFVEIYGTIEFYGGAGAYPIDGDLDYMQPLSLYIGKNVKFIDPKTSEEDKGWPPFHNMQGIHKVVFGKYVTNLPFAMFAHSYKMQSLQVNAVNPPACGEDALVQVDRDNTVLYIPKGTTAAYKEADVWKSFKNMVEMDEIEEEEVPALTEDNVIDLTQNPAGIDDILLVCANKESGDGYSDTENAVMLYTLVDSTYAAMLSAGAGLDMLPGGFNGIVMKVKAGEGTIKINAKTEGHLLAVLIEGESPKYFTKTEAGVVSVDYKVARDSYVYIYAADHDTKQSAPRRISQSAPARVELYSVSWEIRKIGTGIDAASLQRSSASASKVMRNGEVLIIRGEKAFNLFGTEVK